MSNHVDNLPIKIATVWGAIGVTSWAEAASFLAFVLSAMALGEWLWKKLVRPILVYTGHMKPKSVNRRKEDDDDENLED